ncbi:MAG: hypothetical protein D3918_08325 [Candidatus Electrothrix sp. AX2]|nr:hypothetical protein [Candidatus Electrothrix gigas]
MTINDIVTKIRGRKLSDIYLAGFIDKDDLMCKFQPMLSCVYFEFNENIIEFELVDGLDYMMRLSFTDTVRHLFEIEEGDQASFCSVREFYLLDPDSDNKLKEMRLWSAREYGDEIRCLAARIDLLNGQNIFIDPTYHFGIRIGSQHQELIWKEHWPKAKDSEEIVLELFDSPTGR